MFLLRRNLPLAYAGWFEDFTTYAAGTITWPWVHLGDGSTASFTSDGRMHIPQNFLSTNVGGESYEFMPFTPNWGLEVEFTFPVTGLAGQAFSVYLTDSWTKIGATFADCIGIRMLHDPVLFSDSVQLTEFDSPASANFSYTRWTSPVTFNGTTLQLKIWVDDDQLIRVWLNGTFLGAVLVDPTYKFGPTRRCVRFADVALCDVYINWLDHYDRPTNFPSGNLWSSLYADDFSASTGWTTYGTQAAITAGEYHMTGTTAGSNAILRDTGISGEKTRIRATVGATAPSSSADSSLILRASSDGTHALTANIYSGSVYISQLSGSPTSPTWTDIASRTSGITIASGDVLDFYAYEDFAWVEQNGNRIAYGSYVANTVPMTNTYAGLRVSRVSSSNSMSWTDVRIYSGI